MTYAKMKSFLEQQLREIKDAGLFKEERIITTTQGADTHTSKGPSINFCANNYLGLANHPEVIKAVTEGMQTHGFGMTSVRFICGTQDIHKALEKRISQFLGTEDSIFYSSCFDANTGLLETLLSTEDAIMAMRSITPVSSTASVYAVRSARFTGTMAPPTWRRS
jgi:glycine C-acetyltransferase